MTSNDQIFFPYDDSFTAVGPQKKRKNKMKHSPPPLSILLDRAREELLADTDWFPLCKSALREAIHSLHVEKTPDLRVLCLGLGSPSSSREARAQLVYLLETCSGFHIDHRRVSMFDPVFSAADLVLLNDMNFQVLMENNDAKISLEGPFILYMPHCDKHLYENILRTNWSLEKLNDVILVSNSLAEYIESRPSRTAATELPCIARLVPHLESRPLPTSNAFPTGFNNTSVQLVRRDSLPPDAGDRFWILPDVCGRT